MLKKYFQKKSIFGIAIDIFTVILIVLMLIPSTRKHVGGIILRPTKFLHQPRVETEKLSLNPEAYNWKLESLSGDVIQLKHLKNKVIFINMWATWCPPCIAEMPDLQKLYNEYDDEVAFLFVSNEKEAVVQEFIDKKKYTIPVYIPRTHYPIDLETNNLPTTFIISKKGEIVVHKKGLASWNSRKVKNILDILIKQQ